MGFWKAAGKIAGGLMNMAQESVEKAKKLKPEFEDIPSDILLSWVRAGGSNAGLNFHEELAVKYVLMDRGYTEKDFESKKPF